MRYNANDKNILKREQISAQLKNIFDYRLTVVVAAMGYGKTTSVKDYLDEVKAKYIWLFVESDEASAQYIWDSFTRQLAKIDPEFGNRLNTSDFPIDAPQRDRVINIVADYVSADNIILVIDDYHNANSPELDRLIERMVRAADRNFDFLGWGCSGLEKLFTPVTILAASIS